jgi:hypothetical protein
MPYFVAEIVWNPPKTPAEIDQEASKVDPCLDAHGVRWVESYIGANGDRRICLFEAPDAESVRSAFRSARATFERVWPATYKGTRPGL